MRRSLLPAVMSMKTALLSLLIALSIASLSHAAWMDQERSVDDLKLMTIPELLSEAWDICGKVVTDLQNADMFSASGRQNRDLWSLNKGIQLRDQASSRLRYFDRIGLVLRDKNHGDMPEWFAQFKKASYNRDIAECKKAAIAGGWEPKS